MEKHLLLVFTRPAEGREDEFNRWYDERHLADVAGLPGIVSGRRYVFQEASPNSEVGAPQFGYLAMYEVPEGHLDEAKSALARASAQRRAATEGAAGEVRVPGSPAIAPGHISFWFTAVGQPVTSDVNGG